MEPITTQQLLDALNAMQETAEIRIKVKVEIHLPTLHRQVYTAVRTAKHQLESGLLNSSSLDLRLQVTKDGTWRLWFGDPAKDYSSKGIWSAAIVPITSDEEVVLEAVRKLVTGLTE